MRTNTNENIQVQVINQAFESNSHHEGTMVPHPNVSPGVHERVTKKVECYLFCTGIPLLHIVQKTWYRCTKEDWPLSP